MSTLEQYYAHPMYMLYWVHCKQKITFSEWVHEYGGDSQSEPFKKAVKFIKQWKI